MLRRIALRWTAIPALGLCLCGLRPAAAVPEQPLTVQDYCEVARRLQLLLVVEWKERIAAAEANQGDEKSLWRALDAVTDRHRSYRAKLYRQFGTSFGAVGRFAGDNKDTIQAYLEENPSVRNETESARQSVAGLINRFEFLMTTSRGGRK